MSGLFTEYYSVTEFQWPFGRNAYNCARPLARSLCDENRIDLQCVKDVRDNQNSLRIKHRGALQTQKRGNTMNNTFAAIQWILFSGRHTVDTI